MVSPVRNHCSSPKFTMLKECIKLEKQKLCHVSGLEPLMQHWPEVCLERTIRCL